MRCSIGMECLERFRDSEPNNADYGPFCSNHGVGFSNHGREPIRIEIQEKVFSRADQQGSTAVANLRRKKNEVN